MVRHLRPWILLILLFAGPLAACGGSWRTQGIAPAYVVTEEKPAKVRLQLHGSQPLELDRPVMEGDTIVGTRQGEPRRVALSRVRALQLHRPGTGSGGLAGILSAVFLGVIFAAAASYN